MIKFQKCKLASVIRESNWAAVSEILEKLFCNVPLLLVVHWHMEQ